jgi:hypothetical protein
MGFHLTLGRLSSRPWFRWLLTINQHHYRTTNHHYIIITIVIFQDRDDLFIPPTIFWDPPPDSVLLKHEVFAPLLPIITPDSELVISAGGISTKHITPSQRNTDGKKRILLFVSALIQHRLSSSPGSDLLPWV